MTQNSSELGVRLRRVGTEPSTTPRPARPRPRQLIAKHSARRQARRGSKATVTTVQLHLFCSAGCIAPPRPQLRRL